MSQKEFNDHDEEEGSATGGRSGEVEFRDFLAAGDRLRDDQLPPDERKRLLNNHKDIHESNVKKQKTLRDARVDLRNGKTSLENYRNGLAGAESTSQYKPHLILANAAQFSGQDRQIAQVPDKNISEANEADRNRLENEYRLRHQPELGPRFNPKPLPGR